MSRRKASLALVLSLVVATGCSTAASTEDEILFGTADTALFVAGVAETIFWEVPRFLLWTTPKAFLYEFPRAGILALASRRTHVEICIEQLSAEEISVEEELEVCDELRELTGIPIRTREGWKAWWVDGRELPEEDWLGTFVESQITLLEAPDYFRRATAIEHLQTIYGTSLGYDPKKPPEELRMGAERWRAHFEAKGPP